MCIKNFIGEKIIFDKFTAFFNLDIFQPSLIYNTAGSAYFMKSILLVLSLFYLNSLHTNVPDIFQMCMKNSYAE